MKTYVLNITVPAKNKKFYERVVLNLYPIIFHTEKDIEDLFLCNNVISFIQLTVKTKQLYDEAIIYVRNITDIENIQEETIPLKDLVSERMMNFEEN